MKKILTNTFLGASMALISSNLNGQEIFSKIINGGTSDANKVASAYAGPLLGALGNNLNNGWYSTADPLKLGRFKFELNVPLTFPDASQKTFNVNDLGLENIVPAEPKDATSPTAFGSHSSSANLNVVKKFNGQTNTLTSFALKGSSLPVLPMINPQLSVGLVFGTELMFRYLPSIDIKGFKTKYWGLGVKHDVKQWIPVIKQLPFSLSFIGAYSHLDASYDFGNNLIPSDYATSQFLNLDGNDLIKTKPNLANQKLILTTNAWNANLIISKKLPIVTIFGGLRLLATKSTLSFDGYFPIKTIDTRTTVENIPNANLGKTANAAIENPMKMEYNKTSFGINAGTRIKLGLVSILVDGTFVPGGFSSITSGIGFGFFN